MILEFADHHSRLQVRLAQTMESFHVQISFNLKNIAAAQLTFVSVWHDS